MPEPSLTHVDLEFRLRLLDAGQLPPFKGVTIRGALGHHLKRLACHVEHRDCGRCLLRTRCVFPVFFEGVAPEDRLIMRRYPFVPQPFVLVVDPDETTEFLAGDHLAFGMRIFGQAAEHVPYIVFAFMQIGMAGLGQGRMRFAVERVSDGEDVIFAEGDERIGAPAARSLTIAGQGDTAGTAVAAPADAALEAVMRFVTPVRLREQGGLAKDLSFGHLFRAIVRRLSILSHFYGQWIGPPHEHGGLLDMAERVEILHNGLRWVEFDRFSTRQRRRMTLGGLIGELRLRGPLGPLLAWLRAAELVHVGKAASFGFGRIQTKVSGE